jgi:hypothetical protein
MFLFCFLLCYGMSYLQPSNPQGQCSNFNTSMLCKVYLLGSIWNFGIKMLHFQEYNIKVMIDGIALEYGIK